MGQIPINQSQTQLQSPLMPRATGEGRQRDEAATKGLTGALDNATDVLARVHDVRQIGEAQVFASERLSDIHSRAQEDIDLDGQDKYLNEIDKVGSEAAKTISNQLARENFVNNFDLSSIATKNSIKDSFRKRNIKAAQDILEYQRQQLINNFPSLDPAQQSVATQIFKKQMMDSVNTGLFTKGDADSMWQNTQKEILTADARHKAAMGDYAGVIAELKNPNGDYKLLPQADKDELIISTEALQKKTEKESEVALKQGIAINEDNFTKRLIDPQSTPLDEGEVLIAMKAGDISPEFAKATVNLLRSPKTVDAQTKDDAFIEFNNKFAEIGKKGKDATLEEMAKFRNDIINAHAQGRLDASDTQKFLKDGNKAFEERLNKAADTVLSKTNPKSFLQAISLWSDEYAGKRPEVKARMYRGLMDGLRQNKDPQETLNNVIKQEIIRDNPNVPLSGGTPNNIISSSGGIKAGIYPGPSDSKAVYAIKNGQVVAKGSSETQQVTPTKKYRTGDKIRIKGNDYLVVGFYKDGEPQVEKANAQNK